MCDDECEKCTICLEQFQGSGRNVTLGCHHRFHDRCAAQLVASKSSTKCPLCRADFALISVEEDGAFLNIAETEWPTIMEQQKARRSVEDRQRAFIENLL